MTRPFSLLILAVAAATLTAATASALLLAPTTPTVPPIVHVQDVYAQTLGTGTSQAVTLTGTTLHNFLVVMLRGNGGSNTITSTTISSNNGTACAHATGAFGEGGASNSFTDVWYCQNNAAAGSVTFTGTWVGGTGTASVILMLAAEFSGVKTAGADAGVGHATLATGVSSYSIATTGSVPQVNDLVVSLNNPDATGATSTGQIDFVTDPSLIFSYTLTNAVGTVTHTYTGAGSNVVGSIAAFEHP